MHSGLRAQQVLSVIQVYHRAWRGPQAGDRKQETRILPGLSPSVALAEFDANSARIAAAGPGAIIGRVADTWTFWQSWSY